MLARISKVTLIVKEPSGGRGDGTSRRCTARRRTRLIVERESTARRWTRRSQRKLERGRSGWPAKSGVRRSKAALVVRSAVRRGLGQAARGAVLASAERCVPRRGPRMIGIPGGPSSAWRLFAAFQTSLSQGIGEEGVRSSDVLGDCPPAEGRVASATALPWLPGAFPRRSCRIEGRCSPRALALPCASSVCKPDASPVRQETSVVAQGSRRPIGRLRRRVFSRPGGSGLPGRLPPRCTAETRRGERDRGHAPPIDARRGPAAGRSVSNQERRPHG